MEMMMSSANQEKTHECLIKTTFEKLKEKMIDTVKETKKMGEDDPRRVIHSIKVGLALTIVSLFYYFRPLYDGFGQAGMWAILTVVVVFEFSVGGTISKGLNRGAATLLAATLGVGAEFLANDCGEIGEPIVLGLLVFTLAAVFTFMRFFPNVKRRYDYGVMVFILTFTLVAVSGARASEIWKMAHQRLTTILIGGATCMVISLCFCPVWAGQDLHNLIAANIGKLATFLEGFGGQFCISSSDDKDMSYLQSHKSVLNSKATEELLANFAWWELGHGRFKFIHPWKLYLNVGGLVASEFQQKIQPACVKMSIESGKALKELAAAIKNTTFPSSAVEIHLHNSKAAADELKNIMENFPLPTKADLKEIVPILVIASVLIDIIKFVEKISVSVNELSRKAGFKELKSTAITNDKQLLHRGTVKPVDDGVVVIDIVKPIDDQLAVDIVEIKMKNPTQG
ncbi:aluminum activated malate transporter family protein [Perilla frutescens var. hirtella]|nr:aluminum activated malate transporter family protein [Perilla frutescens var. hirtella]